MRGDNPIGSRAEDRLGRTGFADHLAVALRGASADQGLVVALVGSWGSGKTSILNMVREQLSNAPSRTVLTFNPWMFSGTAAPERAALHRGKGVMQAVAR